MAEIRLQRFLAQAGIASRRASEQLILAGRVSVNGKVVRELGTKVDPDVDRVLFDKRRVIAQDHVWLLLNKPDSTVSTVSDPEGRRTVLDVVGPQQARLFPVGRLDYHTQGALLLTNDGELAARLLHPRDKLPRTYHAKIHGVVTSADLDKLREGVLLDTGERVRAEASLLGDTGKHTWVELTLDRGLNRQIHRMFEAIERRVLRLTRVSFAGLTVEGLRPGEYRPLRQREINELRAAVALPGQTRRDAPRTSRREKRARPAKAQPAKAQPTKARPAKARPTKARPTKARPDKTQPRSRGRSKPKSSRSRKK